MIIADVNYHKSEMQKAATLPIAGVQLETASLRNASDSGRLRVVCFFVAVGCVAVIGGALRLAWLGGPSLYVDEFFTIARCGMEPLDTVRALGYVPTRLSLWFAGTDLQRVSLESISSWQSAGVTEAAARFGPAVVGLLTIPLVAFASRSFLGSRGAVYLALMLAISPWHLYWSQSARFYSLQFLLFAIGFCLVCSAVYTRSLWRISLGFSLMVIAHLTQPITVAAFGAVCFVFGGICLIRWHDRFMRRALIVMIFAGAAATVIAGMALFGKPDDLSSFSEQSWGVDPVTMVLGTVRRIGLPVAAISLLVLVAAIGRRESDDRRLVLWLAAGVAIIPMLLLLALDFAFPIAHRYLFCTLIGWLILAVIGILACEQAIRIHSGRILSWTVISTVVVSVGWHTWSYFLDGWREPWREAFAYVAQRRQPGDRVYSDHLFQAFYYLEDESAAWVSVPMQRPYWVVQRSSEESRDTEPFEWGRAFVMKSRAWQSYVHVARFPVVPEPIQPSDQTGDAFTNRSFSDNEPAVALPDDSES